MGKQTGKDEEYMPLFLRGFKGPSRLQRSMGHINLCAVFFAAGVLVGLQAPDAGQDDDNIAAVTDAAEQPVTQADAPPHSVCEATARIFDMLNRKPYFQSNDDTGMPYFSLDNTECQDVVRLETTKPAPTL